VTSAFIIEVNSQLQPDQNEETAALLRVLIYKTDSTTFGGDVPAIPPPWTGPPHTIVQVQAILYASFAASLFSALLSMLGKQWLNRYMSTDMRGTAIERSQNQQQKLNGIVTWYFDYVMESLPLMLQAALLLLGCALSQYLWEMNTTVASVILGVTSLGILFYLFIVIAGSVSASCPYQTPGFRILQSTTSAVVSVTSALVSATLAVVQAFGHACVVSETIRTFQDLGYFYGFSLLPCTLAYDVICLGQAMIKQLVASVPLLVASVHQVYIRLLSAGSTPHGVDQQT